MTNAAPAFTALAGADASMLGARLHIGPGIDYLEQAYDASKYGRWSEHPWLDIRVPTATDTALTHHGRHFVSVMAHFAPNQLREGTWAATAGDFADAVLRTIEQYAPGFAANIGARQIFTPPDLEDRFALTGGHIHHGEPGLDQLFVMRPVMGWARYRTPVKGLFLCGAGTHPGLALTGGSGHNAAREILRALKKGDSHT